MTGTDQSVTVLAPGKLNLGLEVIGKRPDGYHEIRSVMARIELADRISITPTANEDGIRISGVPNVAPPEDLIYKAIASFSDRTGVRSGYEVAVEKRIPSPGGLGGASTDAAATLSALNIMHGEPLDREALLMLAACLGSDVPFFLGPSPALASGTGTDLSPLRTLHATAVIVVPRLSIAAKTATLYRALTPSDFSRGERAERVAITIGRGDVPNCADLHNAFTRPLYALIPDLESVAHTMIEVGSPYAALSGAGPAHYVLLRDKTFAHELANRLRKAVPTGTLVAVTSLESNMSPQDL